MSQFQKLHKQKQFQQQSSIGHESDISLPQQHTNKEEVEEKIVLIRELDENNNSQQFLSIKANSKSVLSQKKQQLQHQKSGSSVSSDLQIKRIEEKYQQDQPELRFALDQQEFLIDKNNFMEKIYLFMQNNLDIVDNLEMRVLKNNPVAVGGKGPKEMQENIEKRLRKHLITHKYKANLKFAIKQSFYKIWFENAMKMAKSTQENDNKKEGGNEGIQVNYFLENNALYEKTKTKYLNEELQTRFLDMADDQLEKTENKMKAKENKDVIPSDELRIYIPYSNNIYLDKN